MIKPKTAAKALPASEFIFSSCFIFSS